MNFANFSSFFATPDCRFQFSDFDRSTLLALSYVGVVTLTPLPLTLNLNYLLVRKVACRPKPDVLTHSYRYTVCVYYTTIYTSTFIVRITSSFPSSLHLCNPPNNPPYAPYTTFHRPAPIAAGRLGGFPFWLRPSQPGCRLSDAPRSVVLVLCYTSTSPLHPPLFTTL